MDVLTSLLSPCVRNVDQHLIFRTIVVNDSGRLNDRNRDYLSLGAGSSVTNSGYNTGIAVQDGEKYDFSVWARADAGTTLTVSLQDAGGSLATARRIAVTKSGWVRYRAAFTASRTSTTGRLTVASGAAAALDMVSLFPRDTYRHEPNGLRKDLAEDMGAMPLPVVPALVTGCGQNQAVDDDALLKRHIQDTLDLIEFTNGPAGSTWGKVRARMGHPEPFRLTHIEVGNGEPLPQQFFGTPPRATPSRTGSPRPPT